jgi:hypothetical protein
MARGTPSSSRRGVRRAGEPRGGAGQRALGDEAVRALQVEHALSERQARRYVNAARATPDGVPVPERTAVFTVRLAPSLIAGLRQRARSTGQTLSATVADAVRLYLDQVHEHGGTAR